MKLLGLMLLHERDGMPLRACAKEIGVSAATLSRVENGMSCDLRSFARICGWLGADPAIFLGLASR